MNAEPLYAKTAINRVDNMPFRWSLNPYRGCAHSCLYCYARVTHEYLGLNAGEDFNRRIFFKENVVEALERQLQSGRWRGESVALGTATDCYQPLEGRLRLTRRVLETLLAHGIAVSITTKSPLILRDLDLLKELARGPGVVVHFSIGTLDPDAWRFLEPGTPQPKYRLRALARLRSEGIRAGILMAPIVPRLNDDSRQLEAVVRSAAACGAAFVVPLALRLPHGAREWFFERLQAERPDLVPFYRTFYATDNAPRAYVNALEARVQKLCSQYGVGERKAPGRRPVTRQASPARRASAGPAASAIRPPVQLRLDFA